MNALPIDPELLATSCTHLAELLVSLLESALDAAVAADRDGRQAEVAHLVQTSALTAKLWERVAWRPSPPDGDG